MKQKEQKTKLTMIVFLKMKCDGWGSNVALHGRHVELQLLSYGYKVEYQCKN